MTDTPRPDRGWQCANCHDTGYVCITCGAADGECSCEEGPELIACDLCPDDPDDKEPT